MTQEYGFISVQKLQKPTKKMFLWKQISCLRKYHEIVSKRQYRKAPHLVDTNYDALEVLVHDIKPGSIDRIVTDQEEARGTAERKRL